MKFSLSREDFLSPLQRVIGAVERRNTQAILANVLLECADDQLSLTTTDRELELRDRVVVNIDEPGAITVPARKLLDICRSLPESDTVQVALSGAKLTIRAGRSRFQLATLPVLDFPTVDQLAEPSPLSVDSALLLGALQRTAFSMAVQDVRYYLNGMLLEFEHNCLRAVTTDGHRLSLSTAATTSGDNRHQSIIPRKAVNELIRLLADCDGEIELALTANQLQAQLGRLRFRTKLIDGRFPDYQRVIPDPVAHEAIVDREALRNTLHRVAILANEKYKGVRLNFGEDLLTITTNNPDQEEAEEELSIAYSGPSIAIGFNVSYLLDITAVISDASVCFGLNDSNSSCLVTAMSDRQHQYIVMPMRL